MMPDIYPDTVKLDWENQYRIISSKFPPVDFFEGLADPELMDEVFVIEGRTNDRLREEAGEISLVPAEDRVSGPGSTPVMAAFTHIGNKTRFSDGSYGVYYASNNQETAIKETRYHRAKFLSCTNEEPGEIDMRVYIGEVVKPMHDIRPAGFEVLLDPDDWTPSQSYGMQMRISKSWGLVYPSVRHVGGECIAAFRPPAISIPKQGAHLSYVWDGKTITHVVEKKLL